MSSCTRSIAVMSAITMIASVALASPAAAVFGDVCLDEVVARGAEARSYAAAVTSASRAWEPAAAKRYGRRFADFSYSGERQFSCTWNDAGTRYRCTVSARPCGQKKAR